MTPPHTGLTHFWIEFAPRDPFFDDEEDGAVTARTYGVTAASLDDALALIRARLFRNAPLPPISRVIEGVDTAMLAMWHMGPMSLPPDARGIWYPPVGGGER